MVHTNTQRQGQEKDFRSHKKVYTPSAGNAGASSEKGLGIPLTNTSQSDVGPLKQPETSPGVAPLLRWAREILTNKKGEHYYHFYIKGIPR